MTTRLPADGDLVTVSCGCTGMVLYTSRHAVHVKVGDPCPGHPERFAPGVIGHFAASQIEPVTGQLVLDFPTATTSTKGEAA